MKHYKENVMNRMHNDGATTLWKTSLTTADGFEPFPLDHPGASWILKDQITSSETSLRFCQILHLLNQI